MFLFWAFSTESHHKHSLADGVKCRKAGSEIAVSPMAHDLKAPLTGKCTWESKATHSVRVIEFMTL